MQIKNGNKNAVSDAQTKQLEAWDEFESSQPPGGGSLVLTFFFFLFLCSFSYIFSRVVGFLPSFGSFKAHRGRGWGKVVNEMIWISCLRCKGEKKNVIRILQVVPKNPNLLYNMRHRS
jgi:hypothetical protein